MDLFLKPETWGALATLVFLEIILGVDNVIFISVVANKLPADIRTKAWRFGLGLALVLRILMLFTITWIMQFKNPLFLIAGSSFSIRDIILSGGGLFLIYKSTVEINHEIEDGRSHDQSSTNFKSLIGAVLQIVFIDFIFSFDSILTAVGLSSILAIMIVAVVISIMIMMLFLGAISDFIRRYPSMEVLALGFLILIGFILILESFHYKIPKGYIYFAVTFSFIIELVNIKRRKDKRSQKIPA
jgi:predicted tellurium resistance membrane protein TerC